MAPHLHLFIIFASLIFSFPTSQSRLSANYYAKSCPKFDSIMEETTTNKQIAHPTTAGAALRLFFHDCFVTGCDASTLITSTPFNSAERDAEINLSLPGDGFDVVVRAKAALELACPGIVSCTDILAVATRNLVKFVGGPYYSLLLASPALFCTLIPDFWRPKPIFDATLASAQPNPAPKPQFFRKWGREEVGFWGHLWA